jgi:hypothetical protein
VNFPVAISEFADSLSAAALLFGLFILLDDVRSPRRHLLLGAMIGIAYLIRFHYLTFLVIVPAALLVFRPPLKTWAACSAALAGGFALAVSPLIALNLEVYGVPLNAGLSSYIIGYNVIEAVDWNDFVATYALWPVSRVLRERPGAFLKAVLRNASSFLHAFALSTLAVSIALARKPRELFLLALAGGYVALNILISRYTNRAAYPAFMLLAILALGLAFPRRWPRWVAAAIAVGFVVHSYKQVMLIRTRREDMRENEAVLRALKQNGFTSSSEVFCNDWNLYNLEDPFLEPFYDYGGYMLLDSEYAAQRPIPPDWRKIRFLAIFKGLPAPGVPPPRGRKIFSGAKLDVYLAGPGG